MAERRSALEGHYQEGDHGAALAAGPGVEICECRGLELLQLDGPADDTAFRDAVAAAIGFALPAENGRSTGMAAAAALWTGPGRWTIRLPEAEAAAVIPKLQAAYDGKHGALIDMGQARTVLRVSGRSARDTLGKTSPLDLHPRAFPVGACATSQFAGVAAQIHHVEEGVYDLSVFRSFGRHLFEFLVEVGEEYGVRVKSVMQAGHPGVTD